MKKIAERAWLYVLNWILLADLAANCLLGGDPRETLSSRMGKQRRERDCTVCKWVCRALDWLDPDHCEKSIDLSRGDWSGRDRNVWR